MTKWIDEKYFLFRKIKQMYFDGQGEGPENGGEQPPEAEPTQRWVKTGSSGWC